MVTKNAHLCHVVQKAHGIGNSHLGVCLVEHMFKVCSQLPLLQKFMITGASSRSLICFSVVLLRLCYKNSDIIMCVYHER